jgi:hypothetical protein
MNNRDRWPWRDYPRDCQFTNHVADWDRQRYNRWLLDHFCHHCAGSSGSKGAAVTRQAGL